VIDQVLPSVVQIAGLQFGDHLFEGLQGSAQRLGPGGRHRRLRLGGHG
jgi:hypothetical protein